MKRSFLLPLLVLIGTGIMAQQDKSKRPSPPDSVSVTTNKGVNISINYSQPSVKGREIGKDIAPFGKVWRMGANEPTLFVVDKDVKIEGKNVPAGKYALYGIPGQDEWVIIINKKTTGWGTQYDESQDLVRVNVKPGKSSAFTEKLKYEISKSGKVSLVWGNEKVDFNVL